MADSNSLDEYKCSICVDFLKEATMTRCGHKFCKTCIESWLESNNACPFCKEELQLETDIFPDKYTDRKVNELRIKCPNAEHGCTYEMYRPQLESHISICLFSSKKQDGSLVCSFIDLGCKEKFATEEDFQKHANEFSDSHFKILKNKYLELKEINKNSEAILKRYVSDLPNIMHDNKINFIIRNDELVPDAYTHIMRNFYTSVYGYEFVLDIEKEKYSPYWEFNIYLSGNASFLKWPCIISECMLTILHESKGIDLTAKCCNRIINKNNDEHFLTLQLHTEALKSYIVDNKLSIEVYISLES